MKSREDEGERKGRREDVGELAGCPRKMWLVESWSSASSTIQLLIQAGLFVQYGHGFVAFSWVLWV
jgi:hypothetical protein